MGQFFDQCQEGLILHVRYLAWLSTAPVAETKQSISKVKAFTRLQKMRDDRKEDDYMPEMPEIDGHQQLISYLWDCGPTSAGGMGEAPLTHQEIWCWQENTGVELSAWEARTLRRLSAEYLGQCQASASPGCPSPISPPELSDDERNRVAKKVQGAFQMLMTTRPNRSA